MAHESPIRPTPGRPAVHMVDDDEILRAGISRLLRAAGYDVCVYSSAADFLMARSDGMRGCLLLDVCMPGGPSGLELHQALVRQGETMPVVFLTGHGDIPMSVQAVKNGAIDFLIKPVLRDDLLKAIAVAFDVEEKSWRSGQRRRVLKRRETSLSASEREIFRRVVAGQPNKMIAAELGCAERTVKAHRAKVMHKMGAGSLAELVTIAAEIS